MQIDDELLKAWKLPNPKTRASSTEHGLVAVLSAGLSAAAVRQWLAQGLSGADVYSWFGSKIPAAEWTEWFDAGLRPDMAVTYRALGVAPNVAGEWSETGLDARTIGDFINRGSTPQQAISFSERGIGPWQLTRTDNGAEYIEPSRVTEAVPVFAPHAPLEWGDGDDDDEITAQSDDWRYTITAVRGDDTIIGYHISGGDIESGDDFGSVQIDGHRGERTLEDAKAAAQADYAERYGEADQFLDDLLSYQEDDDGNPLAQRNGDGQLMLRIDEFGIQEVEVVATLRDYGDGYDVASRTVSVCLRTVLAYNYQGDGGGLVDQIRTLIQLETQRNGGSEVEK